ncbi:hypothetical protein R9C00_07865 [Flammeovirgaceae bacterium SG7u.111]|nr:hypothetical protein [Flammeovirgaceae bacterium SG7u.132]WPO37363.1 hypothetical protein R9C00_07865 [Flammeovirgaceae bacterium SG7u.111]
MRRLFCSKLPSVKNTRPVRTGVVTRNKASGKVASGDAGTEVIGSLKRPNGSSKGHHEVRNWTQRLLELGVPVGEVQSPGFRLGTVPK